MYSVGALSVVHHPGHFTLTNSAFVPFVDALTAKLLQMRREYARRRALERGELATDRRAGA